MRWHRWSVPALGAMLALLLLSPPARSAATGACEARDLYRDEVIYRLRQVQRYLYDHGPPGFVYDLDRSSGAVDGVFADAGEACGDGWWNPVAAEALRQLSRFTALDPAAARGRWLQESYDAVALAIAFEALSHDQERAVASAFEAADLPPGRRQAVALWSRLRLAFRGNLEHPRTTELAGLARRAQGDGPRAGAPPGGSLILAHQGGSRRVPPNTLSAFREARELGADGIECDLRLSRDGEVFVLHDDLLTDPAGGTVSVRESPAARLRSLLLLDPFGLHRASAEHPLTLAELLRELGGRMFLWLELKPDGGEGLADRVGDLLAEHPAASRRLVVSSLSGKMVDPLRRRFRGLLVAYESIDMDPAVVEAHAATPDSDRLILSVQHFATRAPDALRRAQELGLRTSSFAPDRFDDLERALAAGIDFIQTDRPDRALWLRGRQAAAPERPAPQPRR